MANKLKAWFEKAKFANFFKNDFDLDDKHIDQLHEEASEFDNEFDTYLEVLKDKISTYPEVELKLMQTLNSIISSQKFNIDDIRCIRRYKKGLI